LKRQPKQERSVQIVNSVLDGATRVFSQLGLNNATTNKIAEIAGVGIGSLYDYFPNKKSIAVALMDRRIQDYVNGFKKVLLADPDKSVEQKMEDLVAFVKEYSLDRKPFLKEIFILAPESGRMEILYNARIAGSEILTEYLKLKLPHSTEREIAQDAFLLVHAVLGVTESYVMLDTPFFNAEEIAQKLLVIIKSILNKPS
jgi:AcrR family transcriptional regulator